MSASFARTLIQQLHLETSRSITLIGAGGKTTLLYALSTALAQKENTLLTTTTHIMEPRDLPDAVFITKEDRDALATAFRTSRLVALGIPVSKNRFCSNAHVSADLSSASPKTATPKWASPSLSFLRKIRDIPSRIVCEGDGSRRLPVKIPREGEPVFFPGTDTVIGVIGLSCLGQSARDCLFGWDPDVTRPGFPELRVALAESHGRITPSILTHIALSPEGLSKQTDVRHLRVLFNQADCLSESALRDMQKEAQKIRDNGVCCHIVSLKQKILY